MLKAIIKLMRPKQWVKNLFVFAGLLFDRKWNEPETVTAVLLVFAGFCMAASAIYILNDYLDREEDRRHPRKRLRPIASGEVKPGLAFVLFAILMTAGLGITYTAAPNAALILLIYVVMNFAYSAGLKRQVILDVFIIAAGFLLRILAGTIGIGMEPSEWLFLCSLSLTLFLGFGKRRAELQQQLENGKEHNGTRHVLDHYGAVMLDSMMAVVAACTIVSYGLFTMSASTVEKHGTSALVYTLPFVMYAMFRYFYMLHQRGEGSDPTEAVLGDPHVILAAAGWLFTTFMIIR